MSLVAVLSAREPLDGPPLRALLRFGSQALLEYQARQALALGATRIVILTRSSDAALPQLIDRLSTGGRAGASLVRELSALARHIQPDDEVLVLADGLVVPQGALESLSAEGVAHLLVVPMVEATAGCERIDPRHGWAGAVRMQGRILLDTLDMLGDWDLMSTLVRAAVQHGARRVELSPELVTEGRLAVLRDQAMADIAFQAFSRSGEANALEGGWRGLDGWLGQRIAPVVATMVLRRQMRAKPLRYAALGLASLALVPALYGWPILGLLLALIGLGLHGVAGAAETLSRDDPPPAWLRHLLHAPLLLMFSCIAFMLLPGGFGTLGWVAMLAPALLGGLALLAAQDARASILPSWAWPTPAVGLMLLLLSQMIGAGELAILVYMLASAVSVALVLATHEAAARDPR